MTKEQTKKLVKNCANTWNFAAADTTSNPKKEKAAMTAKKINELIGIANLTIPKIFDIIKLQIRLVVYIKKTLT